MSFLKSRSSQGTVRAANLCEPLEARRLLTAAVDATLLVDGPEQALEVMFDDAPPAIDHGDVKVTSLGHPLFKHFFNYELDATSGNSQRYRLYQNPFAPGSSQYRPYVPNGNYEVRLEALSHPDLTDDFVGGFHFLRGDINGDRAITNADVAIVGNYMDFGTLYSEGDVDYDGDVDAADDDYLQLHFGNQLSPPPASVGEITVDAVGTSANAITWHADPTQHDAYYLYRSTDGVNFTAVVTGGGGGPFQVPDYGIPVSSLGLNGQPGLVTWTDNTNVEAGIKYWYRVRGYNNTAGLSHTTGKDWAVTTLPAPGNVTSTKLNEYEVELAWNAAHQSSTGVDVWMQSLDGSEVYVTAIDAHETSYVISGDYNGDYSFAVVASNGFTQSTRAFSSHRATIKPLPLATSYTFSYEYGVSSVGTDNVSISPSPETPAGQDAATLQPGESATFTVSGLPKHGYASVQFSPFMGIDGIVMNALGESFEFSESSWTGIQKHSGASIAITVENTNSVESNLGDFISAIGVAIYNPMVNVEFSATAVSEGDVKAGTASLSHRLPEAISVSFIMDRKQSTPGATGGDWHIASVSIPAGELSVPITFEAKEDAVADGEQHEFTKDYLENGKERVFVIAKGDGVQSGPARAVSIIDDSAWWYSPWTLQSRPDPLQTVPAFLGFDIEYYGMTGVNQKTETTKWTYTKWEPILGAQKSFRWYNKERADDPDSPDLNDVQYNSTVEFTTEKQWVWEFSGGVSGGNGYAGGDVSIGYSTGTSSGTVVGGQFPFPLRRAGQDEKVAVIPMGNVTHTTTRELHYSKLTINGSQQWILQDEDTYDTRIGYTGETNYAEARAKRIRLDEEKAAPAGYLKGQEQNLVVDNVLQQTPTHP